MASVNSTHPNGPMHQPQSTISVGNILSIKLRGHKASNNYELWREHMYCLLESQDLLGYVDGKISRPDRLVRSLDESSGDTRAVHEINQETDIEYERADPALGMIWINPDYEVWRRSDTLVKAWIMGSLEEEVMSSVVRLHTARDVWLELEEKFTAPSSDAGEGFTQYLELCRAILKNDWTTTERLLREDREAAKGPINSRHETALHIAVMARNPNFFVTKLLEFMPFYSICYQDHLGNTALHNAARAGDTEVARILVLKSSDLLFIVNKDGAYPVQVAAQFAEKETLLTLLVLMTECSHKIEANLDLLCFAIVADYFALATNLVNKYTKLAELVNIEKRSALSTIAKKGSAFRSGCNFSFWEGYIYDLIQKFWETMKQFVPQVNNIYHMKLKHQDVVQLVECLLNKIESLTGPEALDIYYPPMMLAASQGIHEVIELIVRKFPEAIYSHVTGTNCSIFHTAVKNRCQDVYNLVYRMGGYKNYFANLRDNYGNSLLHICATLAPPHKLNLVSGAALQMQRELQWFKEIENFVPPDFRERENDDGKTPQMIFTEEHEKLKEDGEKWIKETATSGIVVAVLIATVVFTAAVTVPGGNDEKNGLPKWSKDSAFIIFAISDAASVFTSITSLLLLLSLLTSRYAEEDFLHALPKRLSICLFTLFLSITFMMVAFSATLYLVFGQERVWVIMLVAAMACLPIASFVLLQFPLLVAMTYSTYGPGIFGKKSDKRFY